MSDDVTGRKFSEEEQAALRQRLLDHKNRGDLRWKEIADASGVKMGTLSPWAGGTYQGEGSGVAEKVERYLNAQEKREAVRAVAPNLRFVMTPSAEDFMAMLGNTQALAHMSVLTGAPGIGKTRAACEYKRRHPNVFKITGSKFLKTVPQLLSDLAREVGTPEAGRQDRIARLITRRLIGSQGLIIADEANKLSLDQLETLREFHDGAGIGVALVGNPSVIRSLEGGHRSADFAQLYSRVGMRLNRPKPRAGDMDALLDAWSVEEAGVRKALHAVAKQGGALRSAYMTFSMARLIAQNEDRPIGVDHIEIAWKQLSDQRVPQQDAA